MARLIETAPQALQLVPYAPTYRALKELQAAQLHFAHQQRVFLATFLGLEPNDV